MLTATHSCSLLLTSAHVCSRLLTSARGCGSLLAPAPLVFLGPLALLRELILLHPLRGLVSRTPRELPATLGVDLTRLQLVAAVDLREAVLRDAARRAVRILLLEAFAGDHLALVPPLVHHPQALLSRGRALGANRQQGSNNTHAARAQGLIFPDARALGWLGFEAA
eukprot:CAMPEP_0167821668 /NCGR_PEP_ID=MMETSP0112_2-20121227/6952_1 /TAXON_ID=91324 /ORGANISM="Lotharella globosa, Strain CCCM811" /LENGTH=166 /DNA_ID=CAMNT_0007722717 /DNA_START=426 /DNA_END=927 /DNA_ORIENTATION=-